MRRRTIAGAALAAATAVAAVVAILSQVSGAEPTALDRASDAPAETSSPDPARAAYPVESAVPADVLRGVRPDDIEITEVSRADRDGSVISLERAADVARGGMGLGGDGEARTATLAKVTLGQYGRELEPDPTKPSRIDPIIEDQLAWVVTFDDAPIPVLGPIGAELPAYTRQPLVVFIDAATGEFLAGLAY